MVKIAFMFLIGRTIQYEDVWTSFFNQGLDSEYSIYVHAKKKSDTDLSPFFKKHLIPSVYTKWGDLILAEYQLLKYAYKDRNNKYFVLISDTTIPLKSFREVYNEITGSSKSRMCEFENRRKSTQKTWDYSNMKGHVDRKDLRKHHQWITLVRPHVEIVLKNRNKVDLWDMRNEYIVADETYIGTLLQTKKQKNIKNICDTYVNWERTKDGNSPHTYESIDINELIDLLASDYLFARKFTKTCVIKKNKRKICGIHDFLLEYI